MRSSRNPPPRAGRTLGWAGVLLVGGTLLAAPASAQGVRPWSPPLGDSLAAAAVVARGEFRSSEGDSAPGPNYRAYERIGLACRRVLRTLGPGRLLQAIALKPTLDSLGLDVDVLADPAQPMFALVMVRNPYRLTADAVGYLYWWYRQEDLRMQGAIFRGGVEPAMRVWWNGRPDRPYEWAVIDRERGGGISRLTLFRLAPSGASWSIVQNDEVATVLGQPGQALFADLDHDGRPEVVQWALPPTDSLFMPCSDCPHLMTERLFVEREDGFALLDERVLPSPYATLVTFVRLLIDGRRAEAERLTLDPQMVTRAIAAGWAVRRAPGTWKVEYGEPGERWPRWLEVRFDGPQGVRRYIVHFAQREGRWLLEQWAEPQPVKRPSTGGAQ